MNSQTVLLEAQYPIWAGAGSLFLEFPALSPTHREVCGFSDVFSDVFPEYTSKAKGLVVEAKPREVVRGLPDHGSNTELRGERAW